MKTKLIDLHTHSNYSDGDLTPLDLVEKAKKEQQTNYRTNTYDKKHTKP